jgi:hypothetical protein
MKTDVRPVAVSLFFLPVQTRVPLKFGTEALTSVTCARACLKVADAAGNTAAISFISLIYNLARYEQIVRLKLLPLRTG